MVQPRPKRRRPKRLKRPMRRYIQARFKARFVRAAIAEINEVRRDRPGDEHDAAEWLPRWVRQRALDGTPLPEPEMWAFYWAGRGQYGKTTDPHL